MKMQSPRLVSASDVPEAPSWLKKVLPPITTSLELIFGCVQRGFSIVDNANSEVRVLTTVKNATLVRAKNLADLEALLKSGDADAIAATKAFLFGRVASQPGARVLDANILLEPIAMPVPKGRDPAAASAVAGFVEDAKRSGLVKSAIEKAGLLGVVVAPLK